ncbi:TPA: glycosyltransferase [Candidatus Poribacteria bacterium]|nr:glycosyltransferase [Candidatus Poribacteria bacterium]
MIENAILNNPSLYFIGFYGHLIMLFAGRLINEPILFDAFLSTYDTLCFDRNMFSPNSIFGRIAKWVDHASCDRASRIILDTETHAHYFSETLGVPKDKIDILFVGCDEDIFHPTNSNVSKDNLVLFYGTLLKLHGIEIILQSADLLNKYGIKFRIIAPLKKLKLFSANKFKLQNVELIEPVALEILPFHISEATVCLGGHFGSSEKASRVIASKTFQCISMGKPTIVGENPANHELLTHGFDSWFCPMNDAYALAESIKYLIDNPNILKMLGENAFQTFRQKASSEVLSSKLAEIINKTIIEHFSSRQ